MKKIIIIGTGGLAREFTTWFSANLEIVGYWSTNDSEHAQYNLPGKLFIDEVTPESIDADMAVLAIGSPTVKEKMYGKFSSLGFNFPSFIHPTSVVADLVDISEGVVVSPNCVISHRVTLGKFAYVNFCCGIGHDAIIGDFTQINPGVQLGGFSRLGSRVLIGSGTTVLDRVDIGEGATVGSGSVVFGKVADGATVMGNPAKRMRAFEK